MADKVPYVNSASPPISLSRRRMQLRGETDDSAMHELVRHHLDAVLAVGLGRVPYPGEGPGFGQRRYRTDASAILR